MIDSIIQFLLDCLSQVIKGLKYLTTNEDNSLSYLILLLAQTVFRAINDSIIHHKAYDYLGYFFSKAAAEAPKTSLFRKYFPMFFDMWHLGIVLQTLCLVGIVYIATQSLLFVVFILVARGILFNMVYK